MSNHMTFEESGGIHSIFAPNGKIIGSISPLDDGFFYFFPENLRGGVWDEWWMRGIADKLGQLNRPIVERMKRDLKP